MEDSLNKTADKGRSSAPSSASSGEMDELIAQRDFWEERATKLAEAIGIKFGVEFGEHSSWNDPTAEALEFIS